MFRCCRFAVVFLVVSSSIAVAQNLCPPGVQSDKLICLIPQVYGVNGFVLPTRTNNQFQNNFLTNNLRPLDSAIARQSALLPLASPSSGLTFTWDSAAKVFISSTDSFGPIMSERAETIGKHKVFIGFGYQFFQFSRIDGLDLKKLPAVLTQPDFTLPNGKVCSINGGNSFDDCSSIRDVVLADTRIDLKIHQFTTFLSLGITNRVDISAIIPIENIRMGVFSDATIVNNSNSLVHSFTIENGCGSTLTDPITPCLKKSFSNVRSASGISDFTVRVKGTAWKGERAALAFGTDIRLPSGDALDFLGAGAVGIQPFVVWSYRSRISPHLLIGYEVNGSSKSAGDIATGSSARLPGLLSYSGGTDIWLTKRLSAAFDIIGQQAFEGGRVFLTDFTELAACKGALNSCTPSNVAIPKTDSNLSQLTETFNSTSVAIGAKFRPFSTLLVTGNALIKVNDGGLRATAIPFLSVSYTF